MPASEVQICNRALLKIGESPILALDNTTKASRNCALVYPDARDALLRAHPWNFAIKRATLALLPDKPLGEYSQQYALPADLLRMLEPNRELYHYRIEGNKILSTFDISHIKYIRKVNAVAEFDSSFREALITQVAFELAISIPDNQNLRSSLWNEYKDKVADARGIGAFEDGPSEVLAEDWLYARYAGTSGPTGPYRVRW